MARARLRRQPDRLINYIEYGAMKSQTIQTDFAYCRIFEIEPDFAIVTDVEVHVDHRRRGYGTRLIHFIKEICNGKKLLMSSVPESEIFWQKMGAQEIDFEDLPSTVKSKLDVWGHKLYKQFVLQL